MSVIGKLLLYSNRKNSLVRHRFPQSLCSFPIAFASCFKHLSTPKPIIRVLRSNPHVLVMHRTITGKRSTCFCSTRSASNYRWSELDSWRVCKLCTQRRPRYLWWLWAPQPFFPIGVKHHVYLLRVVSLLIKSYKIRRGEGGQRYCAAVFAIWIILCTWYLEAGGIREAWTVISKLIITGIVIVCTHLERIVRKKEK